MIKLFWLVLILSSLFVSMHGFKVKASAGYKDYNKAVFDALNKARKTPDAYYKYAQKEKARFVYTSSGSATNTLCHDTTFVEKATTCTIRDETSKGEWKWNDAVNYLKYQMPQTELKWSEGLSKACYDHIKSQGPNGGIGKFESGQMPEMRANMYIKISLWKYTK